MSVKSLAIFSNFQMNASIQLMKKYEALTVFYFEFSGTLFFSLKANPTPLMLSRSRLYIYITIWQHIKSLECHLLVLSSKNHQGIRSVFLDIENTRLTMEKVYSGAEIGSRPITVSCQFRTK